MGGVDKGSYNKWGNVGSSLSTEGGRNQETEGKNGHGKGKERMEQGQGKGKGEDGKRGDTEGGDGPRVGGGSCTDRWTAPCSSPGRAVSVLHGGAQELCGSTGRAVHVCVIGRWEPPSVRSWSPSAFTEALPPGRPHGGFWTRKESVPGVAYYRVSP